jgi:hypothetical protein
VKTSGDCALDALVAGAAMVLIAQGGPRAAARMQLLVCARRSGLLATPPQRDVLKQLDQCLQRFQSEPRSQRRLMINTMNMLVGGPWAAIVGNSVAQIGLAAGKLTPPGKTALDAIEGALGIRGGAAP